MIYLLVLGLVAIVIIDIIYNVKKEKEKTAQLRAMAEKFEEEDYKVLLLPAKDGYSKRLFCYIKNPTTNEYQKVKVYDINDYKNKIMEVIDIHTGLTEYINVDRLTAYDKTVIGITFNGETYYNLRIYINDDKR